MDIRFRIALVVAVGVWSGPLLAEASLDPCGKNHYILDEPCMAGWTAINNGLTDPDIHVVAADPLNEATVYAGGSAGVFKSIDNGANWVQTSLAIPPIEVSLGRNISPSTTIMYSAIAHMVVDPVNPATLYAASIPTGGSVSWQQRLFKSTDGGGSWTVDLSPAINGCDNIHSLVRAADGTLFLTNFDDSMGDTWSPLVRTADGAATWDYLGFPVLNSLAVDPSRPDVLYAGTFDFPPYFTSLPNGVLKSVDRGVTWTATGLTGTGVSAITVDPGRPLTVYAAASRRIPPGWREFFGGLYKTMDGGKTWVAIGAGLERFHGTSTFAGLVIDPDDSNKVYVAMSEGGVYRSTDGGATWSAVNEGLGSLRVRSLAFGGGKKRTLFAGTAAGVYSNNDLR